MIDKIIWVIAGSGGAGSGGGGAGSSCSVYGNGGGGSVMIDVTRLDSTRREYMSGSGCDGFTGYSCRGMHYPAPARCEYCGRRDGPDIHGNCNGCGHPKA